MSEDFISDSIEQVPQRNNPSKQPREETRERKERHGCLTAYLGFILLANTVAVLMFVVTAFLLLTPLREELVQELPSTTFILFVFNSLNIVFAVALFWWRKWGFWGFTINSIVLFILNLIIGSNMIQTLLGIAGIPILYAVLQIGDKNKGWTQLQ